MSGTIVADSRLYFMFNLSHHTNIPLASSIEDVKILQSDSSLTTDTFNGAYSASLNSGMSKNDLYIDARSLYVDALFVSCHLVANGDYYSTPGPDSFNFTTEIGGLLISAEDPNFCGGPTSTGIFYMMLQNTAFIGHHNFSITISKYEDSHRITAGQPVYATVPMGLMALYKFNLPDTSSQQISIALRSVDGDGDLYVKLGAPAGIQSYDFKSVHSGGLAETVVISEAAIAACAAASCTVYIAVYGFIKTLFMLTVALDDTLVLLFDSVPEQSSVSKVRGEK